MKRQKTKKVNGLLIFSICLLILAIATPITLSFFTAQKSGTKEITFGKIELKEGVTQVNLNVESLVAGSELFMNDVVVAKDIFSEDMIVRAKAPFSVETTPTNNNFNTIGVNGTLSLEDLLNGGEFICLAGDGTNVEDDSKLYILTYDHDSDNTTDEITGYTTANGHSLENGATAYDYYVINDVAYPSVFKGEENTYFVVITSAKYKTNATGQFLDANGDVVEAANKIAYAGTPIIGTIKTARVNAIQVVDAAGNIYNQYLNIVRDNNGDFVSGTYTLVDTDENVGTGYATGYRWLYADGYYYLANWDGDANTTDTDANKYNNPAYEVSFTTALSVATFYNITKAESLVYDPSTDEPVDYDLEYGIGSGNGTLTADLTSADDREAMLNYFYNADIFEISSNHVITDYTTGNAKHSLNYYLTALQTAKAGYTAQTPTVSKTEYKTAIQNYKEAMDLLAVKLAGAQELFLFIGANEIPSELSQADEYAQGGKEFNVEVTFDAIQSKYLSTTVSSTTYYVVGNSASPIATLLTQFGGGDTLFAIPAPAQP